MGLFFKVLETSDLNNTGVELQVKEGLLIGRAKGNWIIEDDRISTTHAEVQSNNQGHLLLIDKDSRNGIKIQGKRVTKAVLYPGLIFQLGDTIIEVLHKELIETPELNPEKDKLQGLIDQARGVLNELEPNMKYRKPLFFKDPVKLTVIQGLQLNQRWQVEYGPYQFGAGTVGGLLVGKHMPNFVFELFPGKKGPVLRPLTEDRILKLNSILLRSESILEKEDILSIHLPNENVTRIRFTF